ncbi:MAG: hypothetical protein AAGF82_10440 [Pseudomonadota bacterium]
MRFCDAAACRYQEIATRSGSKSLLPFRPSSETTVFRTPGSILIWLGITFADDHRNPALACTITLIPALDLSPNYPGNFPRLNVCRAKMSDCSIWRVRSQNSALVKNDLFFNQKADFASTKLTNSIFIF